MQWLVFRDDCLDVVHECCQAWFNALGGEQQVIEQVAGVETELGGQMGDAG